MTIEIEPIGVVHSPYAEPSDVPRKAADRMGVRGTLEIFSPYRRGLRDLEGFSHIVLLWHFHKSNAEAIDASPPYDVGTKGVFATRSPMRPNRIGLSVVELERIDDGIVHIRSFDCADGTPVLDIKPYIPGGIDPDSVRLGWLDEARKAASERRSDDRSV